VGKRNIFAKRKEDTDKESIRDRRLVTREIASVIVAGSLIEAPLAHPAAPS